MIDVADLLDRAREKGLHIVTAESCTGGKVASQLTEIAGSSAVFDRGYVTYSNQAKQDMLGVAKASLDTFGAVSEQVAVEMADGALIRSGADLVVSVTGIAGPGGSEHKPEGRVCFALARKGQKTRSETQEFGPLGRAEVRHASTIRALELLSASVGQAGSP